MMEIYLQKYYRYGADTVAGLHSDPPLMFTEEFQVEFFKQYFSVFDTFRNKGLVGEVIYPLFRCNPLTLYIAYLEFCGLHDQYLFFINFL